MRSKFNIWTFKFNNFSELQISSVISDSPLPATTRERHYDALHTNINMWLTPNIKAPVKLQPSVKNEATDYLSPIKTNK